MKYSGLNKTMELIMGIIKLKYCNTYGETEFILKTQNRVSLK